MIMQGSNMPITLNFTDSMTEIKDLDISLFAEKNNELLKEWRLADVSISGKTILATLTQEETLNFPAGPAIIDVKWLDADGNSQFANEIRVDIGFRRSKTIMSEK